MYLIDLIIAIRNEEENIPVIIEQIKRIDIDNCQIRILFIEDNSNDRTIDVLRNVALTDPSISYYSIDNKLGQGMALSFGILKSNADAVITLDVDGSHPAVQAEQMIRLWLKGHEYVQGTRLIYDERPLFRKAGSYLYVWFFSIISTTNLFVQNVHFRLMGKKAIIIYKNKPAWWYTNRVVFKEKHLLSKVVIPFDAPERVLGQSKFNLKRILSSVFGSLATLIHPVIIIFVNLLVGITAYLIFQKLIFIIILLFLFGINLFIMYKRRKLSVMDSIRIKEHKQFDI